MLEIDLYGGNTGQSEHLIPDQSEHPSPDQSEQSKPKELTELLKA